METAGRQNNLIGQSDEISLKEIILKLREYWHYLISKWLIILIFGILGGVLGFYYAYRKQAVYTATTTFVVEGEQTSGSGLGNLAGLASMAGVDLGGGGGGIFQGDNLLELYKSRKMIEKTLLTEVNFQGKKELLIEQYIDVNHLKQHWETKPEILKIDYKILENNRLKDSLINQFVADINKNYLMVAKPDKKLSIIKVDVKSKDEFFAKNFNDELVKNVNDFYVQTKTKKAQDNVKILQRQTDSVRAVMNGSIFTAAAVLDATPNLNPTRQLQRTAPMQKSQFNAETNKTILASLVQNLELSKMTLLKETPLIQVIDQPVFPLIKDKFSNAKGIVVGGFIFSFLMMCFLIVRLSLTRILADDKSKK